MKIRSVMVLGAVSLGLGFAACSSDDDDNGGGTGGLGGGEPSNTCVNVPESERLDGVRVPDGFCAWRFADDLREPRGMARASNGDLLVLERGEGRITALWDANDDGLSGDGERAVLAQVKGSNSSDTLNHGLAIHGSHVYASTATTVYRWPYTAGDRATLGERQTVVTGIPGGGNHTTRSLVVDNDGRLYVSVGSGGNVDNDSTRSRIRRFSADQVNAGNVAFDSGELFADGLRNEVGLAFDGQNRLWGVENGRDDLERDDLGGDIHTDNPGEELNLFTQSGRFYGYPYCWSEFLLPESVGGQGPTTQWADPQFMDDGTHTDAWCRDTNNVEKPKLVLPAHTAPLGLAFYDGNSFPEEMRGDAFVALHGSWNREPPIGYQVARVTFENGNPTGYESFMANAGDSADGWPHRPVEVAVGSDGALFVTSDASSAVLAIGYQR